MKTDNLCVECFESAIKIARIQGNSFEKDLLRLNERMYKDFHELVDSCVIRKINDTLDVMNLPHNAVDVFRK